MILRGSRYEHLATTLLQMPDGRVVSYLRMRFIPSVHGVPGYTVQQADRPDLVAYRVLGDPEQFWRVCDVNRAQLPAELTSTPGRRLIVPGSATS